jgi:RHS repeat-associated protein
LGQRPCFAADGNLRNNGVFTFTYDSANRLITVTNGTTLTLGYRYNGDGARAAKTVNGVTTTYIIAVLGLPQVLVETTGGQSTVYLYGHDLLAEEGTAWAWHLGDGLGSVRQLINGTGDVTLAQGYTPFGVPLWSEGSAASGYGFTGEQEDAAVGLVFLRVRYYDPAVGRFIGRDPLPGNVRQPGSLNRWVYVLNNSPNLVDPLGLQPGPGFIERGVNRAIWDFERGADRWLYDASYLSVVEEVYDATKANLVAGRYLAFLFPRLPVI